MMYPESQPYESGQLDVGDGHSLTYGRFGKRGGKPVVVLHGGPGAGCAWNEYRYFDPEVYDVLLFDQRGSGKSTPYASVHANTIAHLIEDVERFRKHCGHESWTVAGGSWGSTLAMFYAAKYPQRIDRMLLRGTFFGDSTSSYDIIDGAAARRYPNKWFQAFRDWIPAPERVNGLTQPYYDRLTSGDKALEIEASRIFARWNTSILTLTPRQDLMDALDADPMGDLAGSRIFLYYVLNEFKDAYKPLLLNAMKAMNVPVDIVHGRQDHICPLQDSIDLDAVCRNSRLHIIDQCGHSMSEPKIKEAFVQITDGWKKERTPAVRPQGPMPG